MMGGYIIESGQKLQTDEYIEHLENRLAAIEVVLGLLPTDYSREGRSIWLAFQIAMGRDGEKIQAALKLLDRAASGWARHVEDYARDMRGQEVAALLRLETADDGARRNG